jgi:hypothetical protein
MSHREEFNQKLKKLKKIDKGYKPPAGPVVSWNDIARHFSSLVVDTGAKSGRDKEKNLRRTDVLSVDFSNMFDVFGRLSLPTKLGLFFEAFSPYLKNAIIDGRIALLQEGGSVPEKMSDIDVPENLRTPSKEDYYLSSTELKRVLKEADIDLVTMDSDLDHGYLQFSQLMDLIVAKSTDYRALELIPVNRPVPQDKLQNTPIQRHRSTQPRSPVV